MDSFRTLPGKKQHARVIAELIYNTEDDPQFVWGAGDKEEIISRLTKLVQRTDTRYSYKYAKIAVCDNEVCGVIIALPHTLISPLDKNTSDVLLKNLTLKDKIKYIIDRIKCIGFKESKNGEYYISNLCTAEKYRGKGVGTMLLREAERSAKKHKLGKCSLLVHEQKENVIRLYHKINYKILEEVNFGKNSYFRMIKQLS